MAYRLLILDWDGTLVDSEAYIVSCFQQAMCDFGLPSVPYQAVRNVIGLGLMEACEVVLPGLDRATWQSVSDAYCHHYFIGSEVVPPPLFPGVRETLGQLYDDGYQLAVATGKGRRGLDRSLRETGLARFFHATRCADDTLSKPHPQKLLEILEELNAPVTEAIMVGDTEYDLEMAHRITMARIAVTYGAHSVERLHRWEPLVCVDQFSNLCAWLAETNTPFSSRTVSCP